MVEKILDFIENIYGELKTGDFCWFFQLVLIILDNGFGCLVNVRIATATTYTL